MLFQKLNTLVFCLLKDKTCCCREKGEPLLQTSNDKYRPADAQCNTFICRSGIITNRFCRLVIRQPRVKSSVQFTRPQVKLFGKFHGTFQDTYGTVNLRPLIMQTTFHAYMLKLFTLFIHFHCNFFLNSLNHQKLNTVKPPLRGPPIKQTPY